MENILFIGHDGNRTGAPVVLLHFLRWFVERNGDKKVELLLMRGGDLEDEYRKVCKVHVLPDRKSRPLGRRVIHRLKRNLTGSDAIIPGGTVPFDSRYDVVVGNTIATLDHVAWFKRNRKAARTISWIHELEGVIRIYFKPERFRTVSGQADHFIAASGAVRETLHRLGAAQPISVVYEFSTLTHIGHDDGARARRELNIPPDAFVVGGSGTIEPRKGLDIFVETLARLREKFEDVYFVWVGGPRTETAEEFARINALARRLGVEDALVFTGITDRPGRYFETLDLFALTSREDPFPLVCLEAASLSKPVLCFDGAGGMPEFVGGDAGAVVPWGDAEALAFEIARFKKDPRMLRKAGARAREKVETEFSMEPSCRAIEELILKIGG